MEDVPINDDLEETKKIINKLDLRSVVKRLITVEQWSEEDALAVVKQYRNYLFLRKKYPKWLLPPSKDIDEAWHAHILHTRDYRDFCRLIFSDTEEQFLDHNPAVDEQNSEDYDKLFEQTQQLYKEEFGEYIYQVRGLSIFRKFLDKIIDKLVSKYPALSVHLGT